MSKKNAARSAHTAAANTSDGVKKTKKQLAAEAAAKLNELDYSQFTNRRDIRRARKARMKKKNRTLNVAIAFFVLVLMLGLGLMLYPTVSDWWNRMHSSRAVATYIEKTKDMSAEKKRAMLDEARQFNEDLTHVAGRWHFNSDWEQRYYDTLDITGTGIMGYLTIPRLSQRMPIYHGTSESVLQIAGGHLMGSSLPVGGEYTHAVVSGHTGLPSAKLFTGLDQLEVGDTFAFHVLDDTFTYQVDQIKVVLPDEISDLALDPDADFATLITCTPYGINSHRLLVRGHRIPNPVDNTKYDEPDEMLAKTIGTIALLILLLVLIIIWINRRKRERRPLIEGRHILEGRVKDGKVVKHIRAHKKVDEKTRRKQQKKQARKAGAHDGGGMRTAGLAQSADGLGYAGGIGDWYQPDAEDAFEAEAASNAGTSIGVDIAVGNAGTAEGHGAVDAAEAAVSVEVADNAVATAESETARVPENLDWADESSDHANAAIFSIEDYTDAPDVRSVLNKAAESGDDADDDAGNEEQLDARAEVNLAEQSEVQAEATLPVAPPVLSAPPAPPMPPSVPTTPGEQVASGESVDLVNPADSTELTELDGLGSVTFEDADIAEPLDTTDADSFAMYEAGAAGVSHASHASYGMPSVFMVPDADDSYEAYEAVGAEGVASVDDGFYSEDFSDFGDLSDAEVMDDEAFDVSVDAADVIDGAAEVDMKAGEDFVSGDEADPSIDMNNGFSWM